MQDMVNKDFDKLILKYGFSTVKECTKSFFKMVDPNDNTTTIGDRLIADTSNLVNTIQYRGATITLGNFNNDDRVKFNSSYESEITPIIKINIVITGFIKLMPDAEFYLQYSEDLKPNTVIGDVYKNAFDYAKSIIDGGYAG